VANIKIKKDEPNIVIMWKTDITTQNQERQDT